ncbi:NAD-dependent epimerase/dehydratase family protein [Agreia sp. Leaf283]|uniref:NAD-dependent epimerase/dehydratase family protein n=1 Tax=Agreia sp. Leaf283 TaxID=1736321 RepID=UPI0006FBD233|nr:NAD-dependent epimerase/dehydratase family protein [Agreia sp. Leaf283]KQP56100.1 reductase [Agreia sp. Leaf283]
MRRVLVLGGTGWLGREISRRAVDRGSEVFCLARGQSGDIADGAHHIRADRTSTGAYDEVKTEWDDVVELASEPSLVEPALDALAEHAAHWTLVSSVSVYMRNDEPGADESAQLVEPHDLSHYADAKVAAETSSARALGDRLLIARPGLIVGPGDPSDRFGYWLARLSRPGPALVPTPDRRFVQGIDIADLAAWIERAGREGVTGAINAVGDVHRMQDFFSAAVEATGYKGELVPAEDEFLRARGVDYWAGPRSLPLWLPETDTAFMQRSGSAFLAAGGILTDLEHTFARVLADETSRGVLRERRAGLTPADELAILEAAR